MAGSDHAYPLYDARFEHDACGVGFVAASDPRDRQRVLPLALVGLGNLAHRGAFGADGESSDGAGVALPLESALVSRLAPGIRGRPAVAMLFLPPEPAANRPARGIVSASLATEGLTVAIWRDVPIDPDQLGPEARASLPAIVQAIIPRRGSAQSFERRLLLARRRMEIAAADAGLADFAVASCSSRTVVYKGLVAGSRLPDFYVDLASADIPLSYACFHQRYATNTTPRWALAQPFRLIAHNGEINTVRGNREELRGRLARLGGALGKQLRELSVLLTPDGSDSLSLDEALDLLMAAGWPLDAALMLAIPEATALRTGRLPELEVFQRQTAGLLSPWDGPAAIVFSDGRRVGAMLDRNGLRPAAVTVTHSGLVAVASEAGAVPIAPGETAERSRLGPGEMLLADPRAGAVLHDTEAKLSAIRSMGWASARLDGRAMRFATASTVTQSSARDRWIHGLDAERQRLDIKAMALEGQEPLWSMGDDTPTAALGRLDRRVADHLRQSFAQVTNPAIDPERERVVMDLAVQLGRRTPLLGQLPARPATLPLASPFLAGLEGLRAAFHPRRVRTLDATWDAAGERALAAAVAELARRAVSAARSGVQLLVISDRRAGEDRLPIPSALAVGAVNSALTNAGLRGQADILADAGDVLDVHSAAMALACGARAVCPWLAVELAADLAGSRGAESLTPTDTVANLLKALDKGLRKVLARMGISAVSSYIGGQFFDVLELSDAVISACFPTAPAWSGPVGFEQLADRQLRRLANAPELGAGERLPDPGFVRFRADGEHHLYAPVVVKAAQALAEAGNGSDAHDQLTDYRLALARQPAVIRDQLVLKRAPKPLPLDEVEPAEAIMRRFVGAAMSLGALSPEAHQALTIGLRRIGAAGNTGEGGEDPAWYEDMDGVRHDSAIKQVASARFGVTATYLARAEQLEIKIAQGSKPGEGGQLPAKKVTPLIASLRRAQPGQSLISPPPHHDIYSIEDLAQLIADLRAINGGARVGVKLVASLGVGTIAAGVAKAGADYIQVSGHSGGTGASPLSSIKHAGIPWELGLAEAHQVLLRNGLRDRVALRTDGGLQTGRDVLVAALLGAEEYGFGTAALVALGCDMARQCHLDTCPTGIATHRPELRAKFSGTPEHVERFFRAIAEDVRRELAFVGRPSLAEAVGEAELLQPAPDHRATVDLDRLASAPSWRAGSARRADPAAARLAVEREPASATEARLAAKYVQLPHVVPDPLIHSLEHADAPVEDEPNGVVVPITTADRSFGAHVSGLIEMGAVRRPVRWRLEGSAGQSFGAFASSSVHLELVGQANDYVGKGLSGGVVVVRPEEELRERAANLAIAGNTCLYGATGGRLHVVGRAGMRFAVRNSGASAVVEGTGAHACEYMTGGVVVILGPVGRNLGAGMSGGRAYLWDPQGGRADALDRASVGAVRLATVMTERDDGADRIDELRALLEDHRAAGSLLARRLLEEKARLGDEFWLVEPVGEPAPVPVPVREPSVDASSRRGVAASRA